MNKFPYSYLDGNKRVIISYTPNPGIIIFFNISRNSPVVARMNINDSHVN